jgi:hypothetical protein
MSGQIRLGFAEHPLWPLALAHLVRVGGATLQPPAVYRPHPAVTALIAVAFAITWVLRLATGSIPGPRSRNGPARFRLE